MPRLRQVSRDETDDELTLQMYDQLFGPDRDPVAEPGTATGRRATGGPCSPSSPTSCATACAASPSTAARSGCSTRRCASSARPAAGWLRGSQFVFSQHCKSCRTVGISEEQIAAIPTWSVAERVRRAPACRARLHRRPRRRRRPCARRAVRRAAHPPVRRGDPRADLHHGDVRDARHHEQGAAGRVRRPRRPIVEIAGDASSLAADVGQMIRGRTPEMDVRGRT